MTSLWLTLLAALSFLGGGLAFLWKTVDRNPDPDRHIPEVDRLRRIKTATIAGRRKYLEECHRITANWRKPDVLH